MSTEIISVILTDVDEGVSPPEQKCLQVSSVGGRVFLGIGQYKERHMSHKFEVECQVAIEMTTLVNVIVQCNDAEKAATARHKKELNTQ